jgi:hypothetical protein
MRRRGWSRFALGWCKQKRPQRRKRQPASYLVGAAGSFGSGAGAGGNEPEAQQAVASLQRQVTTYRADLVRRF